MAPGAEALAFVVDPQDHVPEGDADSAPGRPGSPPAGGAAPVAGAGINLAAQMYPNDVTKSGTAIGLKRDVAEAVAQL